MRIATQWSRRRASEFCGLDLLVNSAGITRRNLPEEEDFERAWERVMAVNLKGTLLMCHAALPAMRERGGGAIVNLSSVMGRRGYPPELGLSDGFNPYPHSKGGVIQLTRDLGLRLARDGIRVNAVCPAFVHTALTEGITSDPERHRRLAGAPPDGPSRPRGGDRERDPLSRVGRGVLRYRCRLGRGRRLHRSLIPWRSDPAIIRVPGSVVLDCGQRGLSRIRTSCKRQDCFRCRAGTVGDGQTTGNVLAVPWNLVDERMNE